MADAALIVRDMQPGDIPALTQLLNAIIRAGGTTALETPLTEDQFGDWFLSGPAVCSSVTALHGNRPAGFQMLSRFDPLPDGWADIGTYVEVGRTGAGIGTALFAATVARARARGLTTLKATIRSDNGGGLAYYARMGFRDYAAEPDFALSDGRVVGRVHRRFDLGLR